MLRLWPRVRQATFAVLAFFRHARSKTGVKPRPMPPVYEPEVVAEAIRRLGIGWKRVKRWITSPDPAYARKKLGRQSRLE